MSIELSFEQILELMNVVAEKDLGEFVLEVDDMRLKIEGRKAPKIAQSVLPPLSQVALDNVTVGLAGGTKKNQEPETPPSVAAKGNIMKSPIVGTFYSAAAPDKPPYVQVGSQVKTGDVLFIVESMKLMNEVQSEFSGTVEEILVQNGQPVEFGQPIMRIV